MKNALMTFHNIREIKFLCKSISREINTPTMKIDLRKNSKKFLTIPTIQSVKITTYKISSSPQCGKTRNSLSPKKYFVKSTLW